MQDIFRADEAGAPEQHEDRRCRARGKLVELVGHPVPECPIVCYVATPVMPLADISRAFELMNKGVN